MKQKIISLMLCVVILASMLVCGNVFAKTEVTVPAQDLIYQNFAGLTAKPDGWTISGTYKAPDVLVNDTDGDGTADAGDGVSDWPNGISGTTWQGFRVNSNGTYDAQGRDYTVTITAEKYSDGSTSWLHFGTATTGQATGSSAAATGYSLSLKMANADSDSGNEHLYTLYKNGTELSSYDADGNVKLAYAENQGTSGAYGEEVTFTFKISASGITFSGVNEQGKTLFSNLFYADTAPIYTGYVGARIHNNNANGAENLRSIQVTRDAYTYWEYEEGEIEEIDVDIKVGDYVQMGTYNGEAVLWRCVAIDESGPLMLADKIISLKAFDAAGSAASGSHSRDVSNSRLQKGSNYWADSNVRTWLNSELAAGKVVYPCGNEPTEANVWSGYNEYSEEAGFLSNFTAMEKNAMKIVTQNHILNSVDSSLATSGTENHIYNPSVDNVLQNYADAYSMTAQDKVFLLDVNQVKAVKDNLGDYYMAVPTAEAITASDYRDVNELTNEINFKYWLRTPYASSDTDVLPEYVRYVDADGTIGFSKYPAYSPLGIRPAFYLDAENAVFGAGEGTTSNPYTIATDIYYTGDYYDAGFTYRKSSETLYNQSFAYLSAAPADWATSSLAFDETKDYVARADIGNSAAHHTSSFNLGSYYKMSAKIKRGGYNNDVYVYAGSTKQLSGESMPTNGYVLRHKNDLLYLYKNGTEVATVSAALTYQGTYVFAVELEGNTVSAVIYSTQGVEVKRASYTDESPITTGYTGVVLGYDNERLYDAKLEKRNAEQECDNTFIYNRQFTAADNDTILNNEGFLLLNMTNAPVYSSSGVQLNANDPRLIYMGNKFFGNYTYDWVTELSYNSARAFINFQNTSNYYMITYGISGSTNFVTVTKQYNGKSYTLYTNNIGVPELRWKTGVNRVNVVNNVDGSLVLDISLNNGAYKISVIDDAEGTNGAPITKGGIGVGTQYATATTRYMKAYTTPTTDGNIPVYSNKFQIKSNVIDTAVKGKTYVAMPVISVGKEGTIIAAAYDSDKLIAVKSFDIYDFYGSPRKLAFDTTNAGGVRLRLKLFTWDSVKGMIPIDLPYEITDGYNF